MLIRLAVRLTDEIILAQHSTCERTNAPRDPRDRFRLSFSCARTVTDMLPGQICFRVLDGFQNTIRDMRPVPVETRVPSEDLDLIIYFVRVTL
jgi:hypothetical protein